MNPIFEKKNISELTQREKDEILCIVNPYYSNPQTIVLQELKNNNIIYLSKSLDNCLTSFFMVRFEKDLNSVYLGLSCASKENNTPNSASKLYAIFTLDCYKYQSETNVKLILYGTTATPIVFTTLPKIWDDVKPGIHGEYTAQDKAVIEEIKTNWGYAPYSTSHPFVLKGIAKARYSEQEKQRLRAFEEKNNLNTFKLLNINEEEGDRLLITCRVPTEERIMELKRKYGI